MASLSHEVEGSERMQVHRFLSPFERWKSGLLIEIAVFSAALVVLALFTVAVAFLV